MRCIRCQHDCKYRERVDHKCPKCRGEFAFEPQTGALLTDMAFQRAIERVSSAGQVRWGVEHLYYEICRRRRFSKLVRFIVRIFGSDPNHVRVTQTQFDTMWQRWLTVHGQPAGVIVRKTTSSPKRQLEPDIADYSFDRAVICDRARTVDILLANNFHFENNCAVLSVDGYPPGPFSTVQRMLKRNPRLQVFALHDATPVGCSLAHKLATSPEWFAQQVRVVDVGLRPGHAKHFEGLLLPSSTRGVQPGNGISALEAEWLTKYVLELAVIHPEQILKRLFRAMTQHFDADEPTYDSTVVVGDSGDGGTSNGSVYVESTTFIGDADASDGGGDSFG
jgi:hypothetical protein